MSDWRSKLTRLGQNLDHQEKLEAEKQSAAVAEFRRRLSDLEAVGQEVALLADAYGVECQWELNRFDTRHPGYRFRTLRPLREMGAECRNGTVYILCDGKESPAHLADITPALVKDQLMDFVLMVAKATRKPPGGRK